MNVTPDRMEVGSPLMEPNAELDEDLVKQNIRNYHQVMASQKLEWIKNEYRKFLRENWHKQGHVGVNRAFGIMGHPGINLESITTFINESGSRAEWSAFRFVLSPQDYDGLRPDFKKKNFSTESWSEEDLTKCGVPFVKTENDIIIDERFRTIEPLKINRSRNGKIFSNNVPERILGNGKPEIGIQSDTGQNRNGTVNQPKEEETLTPDTAKQPVPTPEKRFGFMRALRNKAIKFTEFVAEHKPKMPQVSEFKPMSYEQDEKSAQYKMWSESDHNVGEILKPLSGVRRIREVKISIPNPVQPLSELFKEVTGHTIRGKAVGDILKDMGKGIAVKGAVSFVAGSALGALGVDQAYVGIIAGATASVATEFLTRRKSMSKTSLALACGTGAAFGPLGELVGLGISETFGQALKDAAGGVASNALSMAGNAANMAGDLISVAGNAKDEALKGIGEAVNYADIGGKINGITQAGQLAKDSVGEIASGLGTFVSTHKPEIDVGGAINAVGTFITEIPNNMPKIDLPEIHLPNIGEPIVTSMPEISDLGADLESARSFIQPGSYSPTIEIPNNAHEWILDANNPEGQYATAIQAEVGKNVGELGKDLSYIEYGLQRGLEMRGLSINVLDQNILDFNRHRLLGVLEDAANWAFDRNLEEAVRLDLPFEEMINRGRETFDEWLDVHALDELAKEVNLDLKQAA